MIILLLLYPANNIHKPEKTALRRTKRRIGTANAALIN